MNPVLAGIIGLTLILSAACTTARDGAVKALNDSTEFGIAAETSLETLDKHDQEEALQHAWSEAQAKTDVAAIRARYAKSWAAYRDYRAALVLVRAAVQAYDAGSTKDTSTIEAATTSMQAAETKFVLEMQALRETR